MACALRLLQLIDWALLPRALLGVLALLCGNGYIVGINQIYDVEIDAINKPFLPVASGELSKAAAWILCLLLAGGARSLLRRLVPPCLDPSGRGHRIPDARAGARPTRPPALCARVQAA